MKKFINKIIKFIYPPSCYLCGESLDNKGLCLKCYNELNFRAHYCETCGFPLDDYNFNQCLGCIKKQPLFDSFNYIYLYQDTFFKLLAKYKYGDEDNLAIYFGNLLDSKLKDILLKKQVDVIIPVPIHFTKLFKRQYNHVGLLCKYLSKRNHCDFNPFILKKISRTKDQVGLDGKNRRKNLRGTFALNKKYLHLVRNKNIVLLDDVVTTGTTIKECTKVLKKSGAKEVHILALARVNGIII